MKKITIKLDDDVAVRAREQAAKAGKSLSRFVADLLTNRVGPLNQRQSMDRFLAGPDFPGITTDLPDREELYSERLIRRPVPNAN